MNGDFQPEAYEWRFLPLAVGFDCWPVVERSSATRCRSIGEAFRALVQSAA
jgi:hypothetical protein